MLCWVDQRRRRSPNWSRTRRVDMRRCSSLNFAGHRTANVHAFPCWKYSGVFFIGIRINGDDISNVELAYVFRNRLGLLASKKTPAGYAGSGLKEQWDEDKLCPFMLLQKFTSFAGCVYAKNENHWQEKDGWQNSFHNISISIFPSYITLIKSDLRNS